MSVRLGIQQLLEVSYLLDGASRQANHLHVLGKADLVYGAGRPDLHHQFAINFDSRNVGVPIFSSIVI